MLWGSVIHPGPRGQCSTHEDTVVQLSVVPVRAVWYTLGQCSCSTCEGSVVHIGAV